MLVEKVLKLDYTEMISQSANWNYSYREYADRYEVDMSSKAHVVSGQEVIIDFTN